MKLKALLVMGCIQDTGIVITKVEPIRSDCLPPDTTYIGELSTIDRKVINGKPCYVVSYALYRII